LAPEPFISIVIPARNASNLIARCLDSIIKLDYPLDRFEVIVADGMSVDNTREIAERYGATVITNPGIRVVSARNCGFLAVRGEFVAFSDADCVMDKAWLKNCVKYFNESCVAGVGGPNLVPKDDNHFARATGLVFDYASSFGAGAPTRVFKKVIEARSHGSNAIYRVSALRKVMPVDETLFEGEDVIMNNEIMRLGYKLLYVPDVIVYHYRRTTPRRWWKQMTIYGLGKVLIARKTKGAVTPVQFTLGMTIPLILLILIILTLINAILAFMVLATGLVVVIIISIVFALLKSRSLMVSLNMPLAVLMLPFAWSVGFLGELCKLSVSQEGSRK
jgi:cellulose synthase/poly-beta-1,6-N-acetylglucosamine synthase-like glycosyltransferase